jgi:PadR family transcriptional regulator PadR
MGRQMSLQTQQVLRVLLNDPVAEHYGLEIAKAAGLASGSLYPILGRLEHDGWVTSDWENVNQHEAGRPRRRYYRLTADGAIWARQELAATLSQLSPRRTTAAKPGWAGGL